MLEPAANHKLSNKRPTQRPAKKLEKGDQTTTTTTVSS